MSLQTERGRINQKGRNLDDLRKTSHGTGGTNTARYVIHCARFTLGGMEGGKDGNFCGDP